MIVDCIIDKQQRFAETHGFKPWQKGLFLELVNTSGLNGIISIHSSSVSPFVKSVSLGTWSGHTYFAKICGLKEFPVRTKVYATNKQNFAEYSSLHTRHHLCHETIDLLPIDDFQGYIGGPVRIVVVDLDSSRISRFRQSLNKLCDTIPALSTLVLLDAQVV
jgi:hypothetical protein